MADSGGHGMGTVGDVWGSVRRHKGLERQQQQQQTRDTSDNKQTTSVGHTSAMLYSSIMKLH